MNYGAIKCLCKLVEGDIASGRENQRNIGEVRNASIQGLCCRLHRRKRLQRRLLLLRLMPPLMERHLETM